MSSETIWLVTIVVFVAVVPAWVFAFVFYRLALRDRAVRETGYANYVSVVDRLLYELGKDQNSAVIILASLRELRNFPAYRDFSVALLGIIDVHGRSHNDQMLIKELKITEAFLLDMKND